MTHDIATGIWNKKTKNETSLTNEYDFSELDYKNPIKENEKFKELSSTVSNFSKNLTELRKIANLTQVELAEKMNVSNKTISHWEKGYSEPSLQQLMQLKIIFETDYDDLLE